MKAESRLDDLRREAAASGRVAGAGVVAAGGPMPQTLPVGGGARNDGGSAAEPVGYYGRPVLKPPPWTWEVPLYLFAGGVAGASSVLAFAGRLGGAAYASLVTTALTVSVIAVVASAALLVSDLGRPARFLNMLRVFKWRSPMSVGAWLLTAFGGTCTLALLLDRGGAWSVGGAASTLAWAALGVSALPGALLATYTGVLLAVTVVPAWNTHAGALPLHFGTAALGSSAALLELLGHRVDALHLIGFAVAALETAVWLWTEVLNQGVRDRALRSGSSGVLVRTSAALMGPLALGLRMAGLRPVAAFVFLAGALLSRFAWLEAGRASTKDPAAAL
jgi:formate-dependent nitrite reductase membrane component NrfD